MKPPFAYFGGKQTMASRIASLLPAHSHYGEPSKQKRPFVLSNVAYQCTAGIGGKDVQRISTKELIVLLAKLGVDDPLAPGWDVDLPNGVKITAVAIDSIPVVESTKQKVTPRSTGKQLIPSPKQRVARKAAATRTKTAARKTRSADPKVTRGTQPKTTALASLMNGIVPPRSTKKATV